RATPAESRTRERSRRARPRARGRGRSPFRWPEKMRYAAWRRRVCGKDTSRAGGDPRRSERSASGGPAQHLVAGVNGRNGRQSAPGPRRLQFSAVDRNHMKTAGRVAPSGLAERPPRRLLRLGVDPLLALSAPHLDASRFGPFVLRDRYRQHPIFEAGLDPLLFDLRRLDEATAEPPVTALRVMPAALRVLLVPLFLLLASARQDVVLEVYLDVVGLHPRHFEHHADLVLCLRNVGLGRAQQVHATHPATPSAEARKIVEEGTEQI